MKHPPGAVPFKELHKLPKDTKLWWLSHMARKGEEWLKSSTIRYKVGMAETELYLHAEVYFFTNYWHAYAHVLRVKAGAKKYDISHRDDGQESKNE
jgi:hypothetical protein